MKVAAVVWLSGWALVGFPWASVSRSPSFENVRLIPFKDGRPVSHALNVLAFVPCGMLGVGLGLSAGAAVATGAGISAFTEILQLFSQGRYPSVTDLLMNTAGAALGAAIASRWRRRSLVAAR